MVASSFPMILFALQLLVVFLFWIFVVRRHFQKSRVYPLYAVRDKFVYLVAAEKLEEDDVLFQEFYKAINIMIPNSKQLTLRNFVNAIVDARRKGHDPAQDEKLKEIQKALARVKDDEVKKTIISFYDTVLSLLIRNSLQIRLSLAFTRFQKTMQNVVSNYRHARETIICPA